MIETEIMIFKMPNFVYYLYIICIVNVNKTLKVNSLKGLIKIVNLWKDT